MESLCVVILNHRTPELTIDSLRSLAEESRTIDDFSAVVVDNDSGDGSADRIERAIRENGWASWARVLRSAVNGGFAAGNNLGIRAVDSRYYLLLNSDTIVRRGALRALLDAAAENPRAGLVSPRLEWPDGEAQISCFRYPSPLSELLWSAGTGVLTRLLHRFAVPAGVLDHPAEAEWTSFACVLIRREVVEEIGHLDEGYFMYYEDVDYCRRARRGGWQVLHWPAARVVHLRGGSSPVKSQAKARKRRSRYYYASRARYFGKFYTRVGLWGANAFWTLGLGISLTRKLLEGRTPHMCEKEHVDIWTNALKPLRGHGVAAKSAR